VQSPVYLLALDAERGFHVQHLNRPTDLVIAFLVYLRWPAVPLAGEACARPTPRRRQVA